MTATTVVTPCCHGRLRPHAWECHDVRTTTVPGLAIVHFCRPHPIPGAEAKVVMVDGRPEVVLFPAGDPHIPSDLCRCGALICDLLAEGWRHLDPVAEAGCLDTRPIEECA